MDSGNSGSLQSSSGDEEYDSRADSISALMTTNPAAHQPPAAAAAPPLNNTSSIFDPLSNYFDTISRPPQTPNSLLNLDMSWSKTLRSDPNSTDINPMMIPSSSIQSLFGSNEPHGSFSTSQLSPAISAAAVPENTSSTSTPRPAAGAPPEQNNQTHVVRNPKKRSRASRRAPTTVLTTDTTNFRAMVQEFTGIPAPPFTSSSPFSRGRLDLYGTAPSSMRSNPLDFPQPPYLRRPFPQKVQLPPPFLAASSSSSSLLVDHAATIASPNSTNNNVATASNIINHDANLFSIQNPLLTSLLQSNGAAKYPPPTTDSSVVIGSKPPQLGFRDGLMDEFGLSHHGQVNTSTLSGLPGLISSDQTPSSRNDNNPVNWGSGVGTNDSGNGMNNFNLSRINGANKRLNYSGSSSSNFRGGDKGPENVAPTTRGEGMMESWICSSD